MEIVYDKFNRIMRKRKDYDDVKELIKDIYDNLDKLNNIKLMELIDDVIFGEIHIENKRTFLSNILKLDILKKEDLLIVFDNLYLNPLWHDDKIIIGLVLNPNIPINILKDIYKDKIQFQIFDRYLYNTKPVRFQLLNNFVEAKLLPVSCLENLISKENIDTNINLFKNALNNYYFINNNEIINTLRNYYEYSNKNFLKILDKIEIDFNEKEDLKLETYLDLYKDQDKDIDFS